MTVSEPPRLYAHRGAAAERPENTLPSFRRAIELGADALEMDLHMTSDGHVVVSHDPSGKRMAGVNALIKSTTLARLKEWDAGYGFVDAAGRRPFAGSDYRIPTFEEVLVEFPDITINIDLKQSKPTMVPGVLSLLRHMRAEQRVIVASFRLRTLLSVRRRGYAGDTALTQPEVTTLVLTPESLFRRLPFTGVAAQIPTKVGPIVLGSRTMIDKCHELGMRVDFWTINEPAEAARLLAIGADGIMTDDPGAIAPVFEPYRA